MSQLKTHVAFAYTKDILFYIVISSVTFGLTLGQAFSSLVTEDHLFFIILSVISGFASGFLTKFLRAPIAEVELHFLARKPSLATIPGDEQ